MKKFILSLLVLVFAAGVTSCKPDALNENELLELELSNEELLPFLDMFVNIGLANGYDYTYVYKEPIIMEFTGDFKFGHNGQSWGINDKGIEIYINAKWFKRQKESFVRTGEWSDYAKYIIFHELAHDVLNLKHKHGTRLMSTDSDVDDIESIVVEAMEYSKSQKESSTEEEVIDCHFA